MALHLFNSPAEDPANDPGPSMDELMAGWPIPEATRPEDKVWILSYIDPTERGEEGLTFTLWGSREAALWAFLGDRLDLYDYCGSDSGDAVAFAEREGRTPTEALAELLTQVQELRDEGWTSADVGVCDVGWRLDTEPVNR